MARVPQVVIIGGGFAGLAAARQLRQVACEVTIVDRLNHHVFQPLVSGHPGVFVTGDLANFSHQTGQPLPGVAQVAKQQGAHAARNIARLMRGEATRPFRYFDPGNMATIGRANALADFGWLQVSGFAGWLLWLFVHVLFLIGFRNRLSVLLQWAAAARRPPFRLRQGHSNLSTAAANRCYSLAAFPQRRGN